MRFKLKKNQKVYEVVDVSDTWLCGIPDTGIECAALWGESTGVTCKDFGDRCIHGKWRDHIFVEVSQ